VKLRSTRDGFGKILLRLAAKESRIVVVSADLASSMRVKEFAERYPQRFFEVGVAEQNAAGVAAGLSLEGKVVFLVSFACFSPGLNWGQIRQSICLNNANVKIIGGHGGLATGVDGATHQSLEDIALMRVLPQMKVFVPLDYNQTKKIMGVVVREEGPCYVRLTRPDTAIWDDHPFKMGKAEILKRGSKLTLIGCGPVLAETIVRFKKELRGVEVINCPTIKPLDEKRILVSVRKTKQVITIEDHQKDGGLGSVVAELLAENKVGARLIRFGVEDKFGESARDFHQLWERYLWKPLERELGKR